MAASQSSSACTPPIARREADEGVLLRLLAIDKAPGVLRKEGERGDLGGWRGSLGVNQRHQLRHHVVGVDLGALGLGGLGAAG